MAQVSSIFTTGLPEHTFRILNSIIVPTREKYGIQDPCEIHAMWEVIEISVEASTNQAKLHITQNLYNTIRTKVSRISNCFLYCLPAD